jgi:hypothetical protein
MAMEDAHELRERAEKYRRLALTINDRQTVKALRDLVEECEALAARLEAAIAPSSSTEN